ncbi:hypothetical protein ACMFMG_011947 [Clarireedia jacksonii]
MVSRGKPTFPASYSCLLGDGRTGLGSAPLDFLSSLISLLNMWCMLCYFLAVMPRFRRDRRLSVHVTIGTKRPPYTEAGRCRNMWLKILSFFQPMRAYVIARHIQSCRKFYASLQ